jgi:exopolyphosphatase / guanosine-5'-triphosphate,3'-diphosphate pyrophosphatase
MSMAVEPEQRVAIIDLGSNSFRMVVFGAADGSWEREDECSAAVRIGEGLAASGRLSEEAMERALCTLDAFTERCRHHGLDGYAVDAVATSAIRDAENGGAFLEHVHLHTGLDVRVLSREQEARYGYLAAVNSTTLTDGCVLDLGGGSLQLVRVAGRLARESGSWRLGAVRMTERFLAGDGPAKRSQCKALQAHVARKLERAPWLAATGARLIGLGGTVRNLATAAERAAGLPSEEVQGFVIEREALDELIARLALLPAIERSRVPGIKPARADIVLAGALVIQGVMRAGGFDTLEVTGAGLREGILFERQLARQQLDAVLASPDARAA